MRRRIVFIILIFSMLLCSGSPTVVGQDQSNNPDVLKKQLADALNQLKAAQDRKNELATENEKLKAQIASMQQQIESLQRESATWAEQTYAMRSRQAAWNALLAQDANLKARWEVLLDLSSADLPRDISEWKIAPPATAATTMPTTAPTTTPTTTPSTTQP